MRRTLVSLVLLAFLVPDLAAQEKGKAPPRAKSPLVVHEWGTFTSMVGSDGFELEGLHHEEEALPEFVYEFGGKGVGGRPVGRRPYLGKKLAMRLYKVTQKMETPVVYFYSKEPVRVQLRVDFVNGLMTQWYPAAYNARPKPPKGMTRRTPFDLRKVKRSFIHWDVDLVPRGRGRPEEVPPVKADDPWQFAREVDAAWVRTRNRSPEKKKEAEAYLFYRGLGTFQLPITVKSDRGGVAAVVNGGAEAISGAYALEVRPGGARFVEVGDVAAEGRETFDLGARPFRPTNDVVRDLQAVLRDRLVSQGLFEKEAVAMLRTWSRSWFRSEGTRVFYLVPRPIVSSLLPIRMNPVPHDLVRVLVGRLEYITPEVEAEVSRALGERATGIPGLALRAQQRLDRLGRFLEPHLRRVMTVTGDPAVRGEAERLLEQLDEE